MLNFAVFTREETWEIRRTKIIRGIAHIYTKQNNPKKIKIALRFQHLARRIKSEIATSVYI